MTLIRRLILLLLISLQPTMLVGAAGARDVTSSAIPAVTDTCACLPELCECIGCECQQPDSPQPQPIAPAPERPRLVDLFEGDPPLLFEISHPATNCVLYPCDTLDALRYQRVADRLAALCFWLT